MPKTPQSKYRFSQDTLNQIDVLMPEFGLESRADLIRYAVSRLHSQVMFDKIPKKSSKKSEKPA